MAIVWGAWDSYNRHRTGMDIVQSPATVTTSTASVTLTIYNYFQTRYWGNDSGLTWAISGNASASGTKSFNHASDMDYTLMGTASVVVTLNYGSTQSKSFTASNSGWVTYPSTSSVARSWTVPARPYAVPAADTSLVATRVSDTQQNLTWTRNATTGAPYDNQYIDRWDNVTNAYATIATVSGTATSYSNTNTIANRQYRYRIRPKNTAGYATTYAYSSYIKTTPSAPDGPAATKDASGNIVVTWADNSNIGENVEVWHAANGVYDGAALATVGLVLTYTHVAPNAAQTHKYKLRTKVTSPTLTSAYSVETATVQLQAPPNAPTSLAPTGVTLDGTQAITLSWQHNPVDTTPQRKYQTQYRVNGGAWVLGTITTSATPSTTFAANTVANGNSVEWQVRTWGAVTTGGSDATGASPWSATATIPLSSPPSATINSPDGTSYPTAQLTVVWGYFDAEGTAQTQWLVKLYDSLGNLLETKSGTDASTSTVMGTALADATTYTVTVQVRDTAGSWSAVDSQAFPVSYAKPPVPQANPLWDEENGLVGVEALVGAPVGGEVAAAYLRVWRSLDAGATWLLVADNVMPGSTVADPVAPLNSTVTYMAEAVSATPSVSRSTNVDVFTDSHTFNRVWLNVGSGFAVGRFLSPNCEVTVSGSREAELVQYSNREKPVEYSSIATSDIIQVKGVHIRGNPEYGVETSTPAEWRDAIKHNSAPMCLRDLRGNRWWVSVADIDWDGPHKLVQSLTFTAVEVDWSEPTTGEV